MAVQQGQGEAILPDGRLYVYYSEDDIRTSLDAAGLAVNEGCWNAWPPVEDVSPADKIFDPVADCHDEDTLNQARRSPHADFSLGITFGHQVADDAKTGSGTTEQRGNQGFLGELAGEPGFEPRLTESESVVLPLNYSPPGCRRGDR